MKGKKNDFSVTFFFYKKKVLHLHFVHNTDKAFNWLNAKNIEWSHANIYDRRTGKYLKRVYHASILDVREYLRKLNYKETAHSD